MSSRVPFRIERTFHLSSSSITKKITARYDPSTAFFVIHVQEHILWDLHRVGAIGDEPHCEFSNPIVSAIMPLSNPQSSGMLSDPIASATGALGEILIEWRNSERLPPPPPSNHTHSYYVKIGHESKNNMN